MTDPERASFEIERFELAGDSCLEVRGRWFGVRGRRFMRPALTAVADGRRHRLLALLDHKPWIAEEGEAWFAAFPWQADPAGLSETELTVAPDLTVPLPPPSAPAHGSRPRRSGSPRSGSPRAPARGTTAKARQTERKPPAPSREPADRLGAEREELLARRLGAVEHEHSRLREDLRTALAERDALAGEREEASSERDAARGECDAALRERNSMLAARDTAQTRVEELTRQWEIAAARGTRRTQERDALAGERDALCSERDALLAERDRLLEQGRGSRVLTRTLSARPIGPADATAAWGTADDPAVRRARLLAAAGLLAAAVVLLILLLAG